MLIPEELLDCEELFDFANEVVAEGMKLGQGGGCFGGVPDSAQVENLSATGVKIAMKRLGLAEDCVAVLRRRGLRAHPCAKPALCWIE